MTKVKRGLTKYVIKRRARVRDGANGTSASKQSAKRTRDPFGERCGGMEYPSKRAELDVREIKKLIA